MYIGDELPAIVVEPLELPVGLRTPEIEPDEPSFEYEVPQNTESVIVSK
jgi:hypothetical protein